MLRSKQDIFGRYALGKDVKETLGNNTILNFNLFFVFTSKNKKLHKITMLY